MDYSLASFRGAPDSIRLTTQLLSSGEHCGLMPVLANNKKGIAYIKGAEGKEQVWLYDIPARKERQLTQTPWCKSSPLWDSASNGIFFMEFVSGKWRISRYDLGTNDCRPVATDTKAHLMDPELLPGDTMFVYVRAMTDDTIVSSKQYTSLWLKNLNTGVERLIAEGGIISSPRASHDGSMIACDWSNDTSSIGYTNICIIEVKTGKRRKLTKKQYFWNACWSSDDRYIFAMYGSSPFQRKRFAERKIDFISHAPRIVIIPSADDTVDIDVLKKEHHWFSIELMWGNVSVNGKERSRCMDIDYANPRVLECQ